MSFWHTDYFEKLHIQEKLWKQSRSYPFVRGICIRKGACTRKRALIRDYFFIWKTYLYGRANLCLPNTSLCTLLWVPPLLWSPSPVSLSSEWSIKQNGLATFWVSYLHGASMCAYVYNYFFLLLTSFITGGPSQEPRKVEEKIFFLLYTIINILWIK